MEGDEQGKKKAARMGLLLGLAAAIPGVDFVTAGPFRLWHIVVAISVLYAMSSARKVGIGRYRPGTIDLLLLGYSVFLTVIEYSNSAQLHFEPALGFTFAPVFYYLGYFAARVSVTNIEQALHFLSKFVVFGVPSAMIAMGQMLSQEFGLWTVNIASGEGLGRRLEGDGLVRGAGLFGHWTGAGFYFCAIAAAAVVVMLLRNQRGQRAIGPSVSLIFALLGALTTLTYSVIATAGLIGLTYLLQTKRKIPAFIVLVLAGIGSIAVLSDRLTLRAEEQSVGGTSSSLPDWVPSTIRYRFAVWENQTIPAIESRPWEGWGADVLTDQTGPRIVPSSLLWASAESQWFYLALGFGIVGVVFLCLLLFSAWRSLREASRMTNGAALALEVLLFMAVVASFTVPVFTNRGFPLAFWILVGVASALKADHSRSEGGKKFTQGPIGVSPGAIRGS